MNLFIAYLVTLHADLTAVSPGGVPTGTATSANIKNILTIVFSIIGALALLVIVISGLRYTLAGGDPQKTAKAKEGILYALVGLTLALASQAIVVFVVKRV